MNVTRLGRGGRRRSRCQATLEFAFVAPLFFLVIFATIDAALWGIETSASVNAAEQAARIAASAPLVASAQTTPINSDIYTQVVGPLSQAMFATKVKPWCDSSATPCAQTGVFAACPTSPAAVRTQFGGSTIAICADTVCLGTCVPSGVCPALPAPCDPPIVSVHVIGYLTSLVPPADGLGWAGGQIPINVGTVTHAQRFTR